MVAIWLTVALVAVLGVVSVHNAFSYPAAGGYDAAEHISYAHTLVEHWRIPKRGQGDYYTPPGYYLLAGGAIKLGEALRLSSPEHLGQLLNGLLAVGTALLLIGIVRVLFPGRPWLRVLALGAFVMIPVALKTDAMFHPQPLEMFLATLAVVLVTRLIRDGRYPWWNALALGLTVGVAQLVRSAGLWVFAAVFLALAVTVVARPGVRRPAGKALAIVTVLGVLLPLPWYIYLGTTYENPVLGRRGAPPPAQRAPATRGAVSPELASLVVPLALAQSLSYYTSGGLPESFTHPYRGALPPRFLPVLYTETWGDYLGSWSWGAVGMPRPQMSPSVNRRLALQSLVGAVPTFLALAGCLSLLALGLIRARERAELLAVALMPAVALAAVFYYASHYPSPDGDTMKGMFLLPAIPCVAIGFGFAVDGIRARAPRLGFALIGLLLLCGVVSLAYGIA